MSGFIFNYEEKNLELYKKKNISTALIFSFKLVCQIVLYFYLHVIAHSLRISAFRYFDVKTTNKSFLF